MAKITLDNIAHAYSPNPQKPSDYALRPMQHVRQDGGAYVWVRYAYFSRSANDISNSP